MCECEFNHGKMSLPMYIQKSGLEKDAEVFAKIKKRNIYTLSAAIAALNELSVSDLGKIASPEDMNETLDVVRSLSVIQEAELNLEMLSTFYSSAIAPELIKQLREQQEQ